MLPLETFIHILITKGYGYVDQKSSPGVLNMASIREMLKNAEGGTVDYIEGYTPEECRYIINVMHKFELAYPVSENNDIIFIPALLPKAEPKSIRPQTYKQLVKYQMKYKFLPINILQKLMVRYYGELELNACWDKGMMLRNEALNQWALLDMGGGDDTLYIEIYANGEYPASAMLNLVLGRMDEVNSSLSLKPEHYISLDDEREKPVEVNKLLSLKKRGQQQYQGNQLDYNIDVLLGNTFGSAIYIAENNLKSERSDSINTDMLLPAIQAVLADEQYRDQIMRSDMAGRPVFIFKDNIINHHPVGGNQTINGDVINKNEASEEIVEFAELLSNNLNEFTKVMKEVEKTNEVMAGDLRDINIEFTLSKLKGEEKKPLGRLIQCLSTTDNVVTIGTAVLTTCQNSTVQDAALKLLQMLP